ncbi:DUF262 domain-containing protein [Streptomyces sp. Rer75]|uniref:GmrSD restriction endonuclease domain-containing protein n=1 Tax=Streptomyces sp. Rer75 TaxID=2750011 RepID=UPI0015D09A1F|nr:DUF262 domain-containing protein [Streptomyces sp. Rer75]QLH21835.1 DUF262 domain-containing protein [Streptomyces sp. Rer75]
MHDGGDAQLVDGRGQTVGQLFKNIRYGLEYYQREYTWTRRNMQELLDDLTDRFLDQWKSGHERADVQTYRPYFLGSIVTYQSDRTYLVDGQQRLTSLLLLLTHLRGLLSVNEELEEDARDLEPLIRSRQFGTRAFTLDVPERDECMEALLKGRTDFTVPADASLSVKNLWSRGCDLAEDFPATLRGEPLPFFVDWLLHRVCLVDIRAHDRDNGWEIFETMNDRGARLTPLDLLKGFLLSHAGQNHAELNEAWRKMLSGLTNAGAHPSDFIKTLLQARYVGPDTPDREKIDGSFHEWVREHAELLGLTRPDQFRWFITDILVPFAKRYSLIQRATTERIPALEAIRYNADNGLTAQLTLLTAAMRPDDDDGIFISKAQLVARFLDLVLARRMANSAPIQNVELLPEIIRLVPSVREAGTFEELAKLLGEEAAQLGYDFSGINTFKLRGDNRKQVRYLLARMTAFVESANGNPDRAAEYLGLEEGRRPYEIEHIWENHYERHKEAGSEEQFHTQRNQLGALLLLSKSDNASYQDAVYEKKIEYYQRQNLLAALLHPTSHQRNPRLRRFIETHGLAKLATPYGDSFPPAAIKERQRLYRRLCELLWNPAELGFPLPAGRTAKRTAATRAHYGITPAQLIAIGLLKPGTKISTTGRRPKQYAILLEDGRVQLEDGAIYDALSTAGQMALNIPSCNGWTIWQAETENGTERLMKIRQRALERGLIS